MKGTKGSLDFVRGAKDIETEVEREGLGTPATRADIENMVSELVYANYEVGDEQEKIFAQEELGRCSNCGSSIVKGKFGAYCLNKCGMNVSRIMGVALTDMQIKELLAGKKILLKGLKSKAEKPYDAYIVPNGTEEYRYSKDGTEKGGIRFKFTMEFFKRRYSGGKYKLK